MMKCTWCEEVNNFKAQVSSAEMPVICRGCGTKLGYIDCEEFNKIIDERDYYKKKYQENILTNLEG